MKYIIEGTKDNKDASELHCIVEIEAGVNEQDVTVHFEGLGYISLAELKELIKYAGDYIQAP